MKKLLSLALAMCMMASLSLTLASADNSDLDIVPGESIVQPRAELCPDCKKGEVKLIKTVTGERLLVDRFPCQCSVGVGQDGIYETEHINWYQCNNPRCGIGSTSTYVVREKPVHLNY